MRERFSIIDKSTMTKRDFIELSEKTFNDIEQLVDDQYPDVDFDREGNVLTLTLEDGKVVVINRQEAMEEMWLASPLGGMHFYYDAAGVLVNYRKGEKPFAECLKEALESGEGSEVWAGPRAEHRSVLSKNHGHRQRHS